MKSDVGNCGAGAAKKIANPKREEPLRSFLVRLYRKAGHKTPKFTSDC